MHLQHIILHLSLAQDIKPRTVRHILDQINPEGHPGERRDPSSLFKLYSYTISDFERLGVPTGQARSIVSCLRDADILSKELALIEQHDVSLVTILCENYPKLLAHIDSPPLVLYCQGDTTLFASENMLACVGARMAHVYAKEAVSHLLRPFIDKQWTIVSGGALGADSYAHQGTLDMGGRTIVVVGSGLCHTYPPKNRELFKQVVQRGGMIVSCFPMALVPMAHCFPIRNRIISGLSRGCLVLQAATESGSLITAQFALDQGREVFALPGSIFDPLSAGCHQLIQMGAKLVTCAQDMFDELEGLQAQKEQAAGQMSIVPTVRPVKSVTAQKSFMQKPAENFEQLDGIAQAILLYTATPIASEALLRKVDSDIATLQTKLFELSLEGKIMQDGMGLWRRI